MIKDHPPIKDPQRPLKERIGSYKPRIGIEGLRTIENLLHKQVKKKDIAQTLGVSRASLLTYMRLIGINTSKRKIPPSEIDRVIEMNKGGIRVREIAKRYNVSPATIYLAFKQENYVFSKTSVLKKSSKEQIESLIEEGLSRKDIASSMGVSRTTLRLFLKENNIEAPRKPLKLKRKEIEALKIALQEKTCPYIIMKKFGFSRATLRAYAARLKMHVPKKQKGEKEKKKAHVLSLFNEGLKKKEIQEKVGISLPTLLAYLKEIGIVMKHERGLGEHILNDMKRLLEEGKRVGEISDLLGICETTIYNYSKNWNITRRYSFSKITEEEALQIKEHSIRGLSARKISTLMNISATKIRLYLRGEGLGTSRPRISDDVFNQALDLISGGERKEEVFKKLGISNPTFYRRCKKLGIGLKQFRKNRQKGSWINI